MRYGIFNSLERIKTFWHRPRPSSRWSFYYPCSFSVLKSAFVKWRRRCRTPEMRCVHVDVCSAVGWQWRVISARSTSGLALSCVNSNIGHVLLKIIRPFSIKPYIYSKIFQNLRETYNLPKYKLPFHANLRNIKKLSYLCIRYTEKLNWQF